MFWPWKTYKKKTFCIAELLVSFVDFLSSIFLIFNEIFQSTQLNFLPSVNVHNCDSQLWHHNNRENYEYNTKIYCPSKRYNEKVSDKKPSIDEMRKNNEDGAIVLSS